MANQIGIGCKLYYNSGTFGSPTWVLLTGIESCKIGVNWNTAEGVTRASPVVAEEPTTLKLPVTGKILVDHSADYLVLAAAAFAKTLLDIMALDGGSTTNGSEGIRYEGKINQWEEDQGPNNILYRDFAISPCLTSNARQTVTVTSGAPVFSSIA